MTLDSGQQANRLGTIEDTNYDDLFLGSDRSRVFELMFI